MSWKCPEAAHNLPLPPAPVRKEAPIVDFLKEVLPLSSVQPAIASKPPCSSPVAVRKPCMESYMLLSLIFSLNLTLRSLGLIKHQSHQRLYCLSGSTSSSYLVLGNQGQRGVTHPRSHSSTVPQWGLSLQTLILMAFSSWLRPSLTQPWHLV